MLCSIDIGAPVELEFTLQVFGATAKAVEPRFIIIGPEFALVCFCTIHEDTIKVSVPKLSDFMPAGNYKVRFEVLLGEQIFVPIEDEIELNIPVKIEVKMTSATSVVAKQKIGVTIVPREVAKEELLTVLNYDTPIEASPEPIESKVSPPTELTPITQDPPMTNIRQIQTASAKSPAPKTLGGKAHVVAEAIKAYADYVRAAAFKIFGKGVGIDPSVGTKIVSGERIVHIVPPTSAPLSKHKQFAEMLSGIASVDHSSPDPDFKKNAIKVVFKKNVKS